MTAKQQYWQALPAILCLGGIALFFCYAIFIRGSRTESSYEIALDDELRDFERISDSTGNLESCLTLARKIDIRYQRLAAFDPANTQRLLDWSQFLSSAEESLPSVRNAGTESEKKLDLERQSFISESRQKASTLLRQVSQREGENQLPATIKLIKWYTSTRTNVSPQVLANIQDQRTRHPNNQELEAVYQSILIDNYVRLHSTILNDPIDSELQTIEKGLASVSETYQDLAWSVDRCTGLAWLDVQQSMKVATYAIENANPTILLDGSVRDLSQLAKLYSVVGDWKSYKTILSNLFRRVPDAEQRGLRFDHGEWLRWLVRSKLMLDASWAKSSAVALELLIQLDPSSTETAALVWKVALMDEYSELGSYVSEKETGFGSACSVVRRLGKIELGSDDLQAIDRTISSSVPLQQLFSSLFSALVPIATAKPPSFVPADRLLQLAHRLTEAVPDYPGFWISQSIVEFRLGEIPAARLSLAEAERLDPDSPTISQVREQFFESDR